MLKHASNSTGGGSGGGTAATATTAATASAIGVGVGVGVSTTANGQLRNGTTSLAQQPQQQQQQKQQQRSMHLRPPQPLNISILSAASAANNLQTSLTSTSTAGVTGVGASNTVLNVSTANGGQRIPSATTLLNIAHNNSVNSITTTPVTPVTPVTPIPNGSAIGGVNIGNNLHTYTNQYITAGSHSSHSGKQHNNTITSNNNNNSNLHNLTAATIGANGTNHNYSNCQNLMTSPISAATPLPPPLSTTIQQTLNKSVHGPGPREALTSLGLLCLVSLLLALLSLIFLLKISPNGREQSSSVSRNSNEDFIIVYDVTLALCALSLSLNLCCLLVCAIQFLFAVKLLRSPMFSGRDNKYLEKSSVSRTCAFGGFFISIPIFLTGIILYSFNHFHSTPAIITSILIGIGIVFCGCAMVHNVFIWQKEKTISYRNPPLLNMSTITQQFQHLQQQQQQSPQPQTSAYGLGPITPPAQFLNSQPSHQSLFQLNNNNNNNINNHYTTANQSQLHLLQHQQQQQQQQMRSHHNHQQLSQHSQYPQHQGHGSSMTPVSPNHSHGSFNPLLAGTLSSSFLMRPATATPPTPKPSGLASTQTSIARATSPHGSVSPGQGHTLDMSNITNASLHELSTLV